jgi:hypothetical protein
VRGEIVKKGKKKGKPNKQVKKKTTKKNQCQRNKQGEDSVLINSKLYRH